MRFLSKTKDGGRKSKVWAYWLVEIKGMTDLEKFEERKRHA